MLDRYVTVWPGDEPSGTGVCTGYADWVGHSDQPARTLPGVMV